MGGGVNRMPEVTEEAAKAAARVLGVRFGASESKVKETFHQRALKCHPDRHPNNKAKEEEFKKINEAHEILLKWIAEKKELLLTSAKQSLPSVTEYDMDKHRWIIPLEKRSLLKEIILKADQGDSESLRFFNSLVASKQVDMRRIVRLFVRQKNITTRNELAQNLTWLLGVKFLREEVLSHCLPEMLSLWPKNKDLRGITGYRFYFLQKLRDLELSEKISEFYDLAHFSLKWMNSDAKSRYFLRLDKLTDRQLVDMLLFFNGRLFLFCLQQNYQRFNQVLRSHLKVFARKLSDPEKIHYIAITILMYWLKDNPNDVKSRNRLEIIYDKSQLVVSYRLLSQMSGCLAACREAQIYRDRQKLWSTLNRDRHFWRGSMVVSSAFVVGGALSFMPLKLLIMTFAWIGITTGLACTGVGAGMLLFGLLWLGYVYHRSAKAGKSTGNANLSPLCWLWKPDCRVQYSQAFALKL